MAAARARERALRANQKDDEDDEEEEGSTLISEETNPMLDEDGNKVTFPSIKPSLSWRPSAASSQQ